MTQSSWLDTLASFFLSFFAYLSFFNAHFYERMVYSAVAMGAPHWDYLSLGLKCTLSCWTKYPSEDEAVHLHLEYEFRDIENATYVAFMEIINFATSRNSEFVFQISKRFNISIAGIRRITNFSLLFIAPEFDTYSRCTVTAAGICGQIFF